MGEEEEKLMQISQDSKLGLGPPPFLPFLPLAFVSESSALNLVPVLPSFLIHVTRCFGLALKCVTSFLLLRYAIHV